MRTSDSTSAIFPAFVNAAKELQNPAKSQPVSVPTKSGGTFTYTFAPLPDILDDVRGLLGKHGLAIVQEAITTETGVGVLTRLLHESGEFIEYGPLVLPAAKDAQAHGSALSYSRRYSLCAALGIAADEDDDGAKAKPATRQKKDTEASEGGGDVAREAPASDSPKKATKGQLSKLATLSHDLGWDDDERRKRAGVESFTDLTMRRAAELVAEWTKLTKESPAAASAVSESEAEPPVVSGHEQAESASDAGVLEELRDKITRFVGDEAEAENLIAERFGAEPTEGNLRELIATLLREGK